MAGATLALSACLGGDVGVPPSASIVMELKAPPGRVSALVIPDSVVLSVTGPGVVPPITRTVTFDTSGSAQVTLTIPIGDNRVLTLNMYKGGRLIFSGTSTFSVGSGTNPPQTVTPTPIQSPVVLRIQLPGGRAAFPTIPDSVVVWVTGVGITNPIRAVAVFDTSGTAIVNVNLPVGDSRPMQTDFFSGGSVVYTGVDSVSVTPGANTPPPFVPPPVTGTVPITVSAGNYSVTVAPGNSVVAVGNTLPLSATVRGPGGGIAPGVTALWATSNPGIARVSATGVVTAVAPGVTTITATAVGLAAAVTITVP